MLLAGFKSADPKGRRTTTPCLPDWPPSRGHASDFDAELIEYVENSYLALKVMFANELSQIARTSAPTGMSFAEDGCSTHEWGRRIRGCYPKVASADDASPRTWPRSSRQRRRLAISRRCWRKCKRATGHCGTWTQPTRLEHTTPTLASHAELGAALEQVATGHC